MKNKTEYNQTPIKTFHIQLPTSMPFFEFLIFNFRHYVTDKVEEQSSGSLME